MEKNISRRSFLGVAAVGAVAVGGGIVGCSQPQDATSSNTSIQNASAETQAGNILSAAPEISDEEIVSTLDTDFLIIGAGNAGMAAAATAADYGLNFMVCEALESVGSSREYINAINTTHMQKAGVSVDTQLLINELRRYSLGKCKSRVWKVWMDESAEMIEWLDTIMKPVGMEAELELDVEDSMTGTSFYIPPSEHTYHLTPEAKAALAETSGEEVSGGAGAGGPAGAQEPQRNEVFETYIVDKGYEVTYKHKLVVLTKEDDRVTGGIFETPEGFVKISAKDGVLLATGGYAANPDLVEIFAPHVPSYVTASAYSPRCDGTGILAGIWAGGVKDKEAAPMINTRGAVLPGTNCGYIGDGDKRVFPNEGRENLGTQPFFSVNRDGRRFCNESAPHDFTVFAAGENDGGVWCQVFDAK
jgi:succinate dehydrogenase/fumarate reductase flavoprotein subunit